MESLNQFYSELRNKIKSTKNGKLLKIYKKRAKKMYEAYSVPLVDKKLKDKARREYAETLRLIRKVDNG